MIFRVSYTAKSVKYDLSDHNMDRSVAKRQLIVREFHCASRMVILNNVFNKM